MYLQYTSHLLGNPQGPVEHSSSNPFPSGEPLCHSRGPGLLVIIIREGVDAQGSARRQKERGKRRPDERRGLPRGVRRPSLVGIVRVGSQVPTCQLHRRPVPSHRLTYRIGDGLDFFFSLRLLAARGSGISSGALSNVRPRESGLFTLAACADPSRFSASSFFLFPALSPPPSSCHSLSPVHTLHTVAYPS